MHAACALVYRVHCAQRLTAQAHLLETLCFCSLCFSASTAACYATDSAIFLVMQFTFGYGVGGEYPMAAGSAAERAEAKGRASARKRGREVPSLLAALSPSLSSHRAGCICLSSRAGSCLGQVSSCLCFAFMQLYIFCCEGKEIGTVECTSASQLATSSKALFCVLYSAYNICCVVQ